MFALRLTVRSTPPSFAGLGRISLRLLPRVNSVVRLLATTKGNQSKAPLKANHASSRAGQLDHSAPTSRIEYAQSFRFRSSGKADTLELNFSLMDQGAALSFEPTANSSSTSRSIGEQLASGQGSCLTSPSTPRAARARTQQPAAAGPRYVGR